MIKLLIGGSPCTFWSIAQKNNRETEAEGLGWELFKNYLIAKDGGTLELAQSLFGREPMTKRSFPPFISSS